MPASGRTRIPTYNVGNSAGGYEYGKQVTLPIYETAWRYTGPVLVLQGTHYRIVPYTYAERYEQGYKDCFLKLIPEEDHSFTKNTAEAALYASDWLSKQIHEEKSE